MSDTGNNLDLAQVLADAARVIDVPGTLEKTLDVIARTALESVPGFDQVGVTVLQGDGVIMTLAATDVLVITMDAVQFRFNQGPCLDALHEEDVVLVENLAARRRQWPIYVPRAAKAGVRAQMGMPIRTSDETLGSLNFYSTTGPTIDPTAPHHAALFATHAAIALDHARHADEAVAAIPTWEVIDQAVRTLVQRFEVTEDRAMYYLVRTAAARKSKLRDAARAVVDQANRSAN
jgi:GAF domain-containing protein